MVVAVDSGMLDHMRQNSGAITVELRVADAAGAVQAMERARAAILLLPHPEMLDSPYASYASPVETGARGPTFWIDMADAEAYDGLLEAVLHTLVDVLSSNGADSGLLTWPESAGGATMSQDQVDGLLTGWRKLQAELEVPPPVVGAGDPARVGAGWSRRASVPTSRFNLASCAGRDGRIYAIGGESRRVLRTVEAYDTIADEWCKVAPLRIGRRGPGTALGPDGRIYAVGGFEANREGRTTVEAYDPSVNRWELVAPMATRALNDMAATTGQDGRIYAIAIGPNILEVYDCSLDRWTTLAPPPSAYDNISAVAGRDGRIYAFGGRSVVETYDPERDAWSPVCSPPARLGLGFQAAPGGDGRIYAMGGRADVLVPVDNVMAYEVGFDRWIDAEPMPGPRTAMGLASAIDGAIYAVGGYRRDDYGPPVFYGPTDVFVPTLPPLPRPVDPAATSARPRPPK